MLAGFFFSTPTVSAATCGPSTNFITTWKTDNPGTSNSTSIIFPADTFGAFNYSVDWDNDGVMDDTGLFDSAEYDFGTPGTYTIQVCGDFPFFAGYQDGDIQKLVDIVQWGDNQWENMDGSFAYATNLTGTFTDTADVSQVQNFDYAFLNASNFNGDISDWDVGNAQTMRSMFRGASSFNRDLSEWDVSNVRYMDFMFASGIDYDNCESLFDAEAEMTYQFCPVFGGAMTFNQDVSSWEVGSLETAVGMFASGDQRTYEIFDDDKGFLYYTDIFPKEALVNAFNQDISNWDVSGVLVSEGIEGGLRAIFNGTSLSTAHYDAILSAWSQLSLTNPGFLGAVGVAYCESGEARQELSEVFGWTIQDAGQVCAATDEACVLPALAKTGSRSQLGMAVSIIILSTSLLLVIVPKRRRVYRHGSLGAVLIAVWIFPLMMHGMISAQSVTLCMPADDVETGAYVSGMHVDIDILANDVGVEYVKQGTIDLDTTTEGVQQSVTTSGGTWVLQGGGIVRFTPATFGTDTIEYQYEYTNGTMSEKATIGVTLTLGPPVAQDDAFGIVTLSACGQEPDFSDPVVALLANDTAVSPLTLVAASVDLDPVTAGVQHTYAGSGFELTYDPDTDELAIAVTDRNDFNDFIWDQSDNPALVITYTVQDSAGTPSNAAEVRIQWQAGMC